jgi:hypothetical protein
VRRSLSLGALLALALLLVTPVAALADPAGPTNYRSEVTGVEPAVEGVEAGVLGGDAFLQLTVPAGTEVFVPGYDESEGASPYLWFAPDGRVFVNERSPATFLNDARYGARDVTVPPSADPLAAPVWTEVAQGGSYAWHDHRVHWMSPTPPEQVDTAASTPQPLYDWEIPLVVDGQDVVLRGDLEWLPSRSPVLPGLVALVAAVIAAASVRRDRRLLPSVVGVAALAALVVAAAQNLGLAPGAVGPLPPLMLAVAGLLGAGAGAALLARDRTQATVAALLATLPVGASVLVQAGGLTAPQVPAGLPPSVFSALLAVAMGGAVGALLAGLGGLVSPLEADEEPAGSSG